MFLSIFQPPGQKLVVRLDPSSMANTGCARNFLYSNLEGLSDKGTKSATEFGQAVHQATAMLRKGADMLDCIDHGLDYFANAKVETPGDYRTTSLLIEVLTEYLQFRKPSRDKLISDVRNDKPAVELPFEIPYRAFEHVDFTLCGVIDELVIRSATRKGFLDIKTTGLHPSKFSSKWGTSHQMLFYSWVLRKTGYTPDYYASPIIDAIFLREKPGNRVHRIEENVIMPEHVEEYMQSVWKKTEVIYDWLMRNEFNMDRVYCERVFGNCNYRIVCDAAPGMRPAMLKQLFNQKEYNPATFGINA